MGLGRLIERVRSHREADVVNALSKLNAREDKPANDWEISTAVRGLKPPMSTIRSFATLDTTVFKAVDRLEKKGTLDSRPENPNNSRSQKVYWLKEKIPA